jgi:hypothetical protein
VWEHVTCTTENDGVDGTACTNHLPNSAISVRV